MSCQIRNKQAKTNKMKNKISSTALFLILSFTAFSQNITTTKFGKGINFMAADSSMRLKLNYRLQQLFEVEYVGEDNKTAVSSQLRRSRLKMEGFAFSPKLEYKIELAFSSADISTNKEDGRTSGSSRIVYDAVVKYEFVKNWQLWMGQTKLPGNRERVISSGDLQFVDRSRVNSQFNVDRDNGFQLHGKLGKGFVVKPKFAFTMGEGRNIAADNIGGFCYTSRIDVLPLGEFEGKKQDYSSSDLERQSKPKVAFGFTYNVNDRSVRQQGQLGSYVSMVDTLGISSYVENTLTMFEADMIFKYQGISALVEWVQTTGQSSIAGFTTGSGFNAQLGYLFKSNYEIAGRYTQVAPNNTLSKLKEEQQYTLGLSKYLVGHSLKVQTDFTLQKYPNTDPNYIYRLQVEMKL